MSFVIILSLVGYYDFHWLCKHALIKIIDDDNHSNYSMLMVSGVMSTAIYIKWYLPLTELSFSQYENDLDYTSFAVSLRGHFSTMWTFLSVYVAIYSVLFHQSACIIKQIQHDVVCNLKVVIDPQFYLTDREVLVISTAQLQLVLGEGHYYADFEVY